ncbi:MAG: hypothetical protein U0W40_12245 [Acidimicrobiia bacterium]
MNLLLALTDPIYDGDIDLTVFLIILGKVLFVFVLLLLSVLMYIWFMRKVIAVAEPRRSRAPGPSVCSRPSPTASSCSSRSSRSRTARIARSSSSRRTSRSRPRSSRS